MRAPSSRTKALVDAQRHTYRYGTIELEQDNSDEENNNIEEDFELDHTPAKGSKALSTNKRWSVLDKLDKQYTSRDGSCMSCLRNITKRCVLATLMLVAFIVFAWYFTRTLLFNIQLNPDIYDFIVVGGGPAGAVVARRLLDEGATVLVLESGDFIPYVAEETSYSETSVYGSTVENTVSEFDIPVLWSAVAQKEEVHFGPFDSLNINAFRGLGGGGMQSALLYVRALSHDILGWDVSSFDWETMLGVYVQLEQFQYSSQSLQPGTYTTSTPGTGQDQNPIDSDPMLYRGTEGYFPTNAPGCTDSLGQSFLSASIQQGEAYLQGFNSPAPRVGVGCYEVNIDQGVRVSPVKAMLHDYLAANHAKERLTLRTGCTARRLLLDRQRGTGLHIGIISQRKHDHRGQRDPHSPPPMYRATGVEYVDSKGEIKFAYLASGPSQPVAGGYTRDFEPLRCLVLATGALHTPVLLMNSGIGAEEELQAAGVEVKVVSPRVGTGLQDHIAVGLTFQADASATSDFGSAYAFPQQWSTYTKAVHRAMHRDQSVFSSAAGGSGNGKKKNKKAQGKQKNGEENAEAESIMLNSEAAAASGASSSSSISTTTSESFGLLGDNGVSAGAFLASPWAPREASREATGGSGGSGVAVPDIQVTLFPAVTEPHFVALMNYKAEVASRNKSNGQINPKGGTYLSFRNQILITVALLSPEARFQVSLNETHPLEGTPTVSAVPANLDVSDSLNAESNTTADIQFGHDKKKGKKFVPSTNSSADSSTSADSAASQQEDRFNIVPAALTQLDVQRLGWAVQRVRAIVRDMRLQDVSSLLEVSPLGGPVRPRASDPNKGNHINGTAQKIETEQEDQELTEWVRENAFLQSNWVGSAAMGKSASFLSSSSLSGSTSASSESDFEAVSKKKKHERFLRDNAASRGSDQVGNAVADDDAADVDDEQDEPNKNDPAEAEEKEEAAGSSVVDEHLSVRNVLALKIADASVIPLVPSGNVQTTVQAVAWRAADFILKTFD